MVHWFDTIMLKSIMKLNNSESQSELIGTTTSINSLRQERNVRKSGPPNLRATRISVISLRHLAGRITSWSATKENEGASATAWASNKHAKIGKLPRNNRSYQFRSEGCRKIGGRTRGHKTMTGGTHPRNRYPGTGDRVLAKKQRCRTWKSLVSLSCGNRRQLWD
jgi:hypothetical protein